jgi:uncharacterized protein (TIGR04255 family)
MSFQESNPLPDYENPPVTEVVCGVLFKSLDRFFLPYLGLLWERFKAEYPECQEVDALLPRIELFQNGQETVNLVQGFVPLPRVWFVHKNGDKVIQVQRDRFLHNWRKRGKEDEYPRYHKIIDLFRECYTLFKTFIADNNIGEITPAQYEMTYVNHIFQSDEWQTLKEIGKILPDFVWHDRQERFLSFAESLNWHTTFVLPKKLGRLHVTIRNGLRHDDSRPLLLLDLTVRGMAPNNSPEEMWLWFDVAHEWIVRSFADLTGEELQQKVWKRRA